MSFYKEIWENLSAKDVSKWVTKKKIAGADLSYISWTNAWGALMDEYPESCYSFEEKPVGNTLETWCTVSIRDGEKVAKRDMWLPVMDFRNNSVVNANSRQVNDARMRCLVKCLAMFGLGHHIYAGEDVPDEERIKKAEDAEFKAWYEGLCSEHADSINAIKEGIENEDYSSAREAWVELGQDVQGKLWVAPSKGGIFTTKEREVMKSTEFRTANGEE